MLLNTQGVQKKAGCQVCCTHALAHTVKYRLCLTKALKKQLSQTSSTRYACLCFTQKHLATLVLKMRGESWQMQELHALHALHAWRYDMT